MMCTRDRTNSLYATNYSLTKFLYTKSKYVHRKSTLQTFNTTNTACEQVRRHVRKRQHVLCTSSTASQTLINSFQSQLQQYFLKLEVTSTLLQV
jgi:hypothetical protein